MMKDVVRALDSGLLAQIGLVAFVVAFVLVVGWAFTMSRKARQEAKRLPLEDDD